VLVWGEDASRIKGSEHANCGDNCTDCRWSWNFTDAKKSLGDSATYRCRDWKETSVVTPQVRADDYEL